MQYSPESITYLHLAYAIILGAQISYVAWLGIRWSRTLPRTSPRIKSK